MSMVAISEIHNTKQAFECLRCGHQETRRTEDLRTEDKEQGHPGWRRFICTGLQFRHHGKAGVTVFQPVLLLILRRVILLARRRAALAGLRQAGFLG